uniref:CUB domain-containing protein n=1 Tax=Strigops habroptila TaxID=2489341 RepID=A0A672TTT8_STRHB
RNMFPTWFRTCGGNIYINDFNPSGYTSSPNYPSNYPPHADCVWTITAPNGHDFHLERHQDCQEKMENWKVSWGDKLFSWL